MSENVRLRFAPSPTGYLHVGGARTAFYNWLYAQKMGGKFILRVEDTDLERSTEASMRMQIQDLVWLGILWSEGPNPETLKDMGPDGPYRQSQRAQIYMDHAQQLIKRGLAYYDFRTDEELEKLKADATAAGIQNYQVERPKTLVNPEEAKKRIAAGEKAAIRFKNDNTKEYVLNDLIRGEVRFPADMVKDFVIIRSNGMPVYNFCCVIDDAHMHITHVLRAEEHLPNTLRQLMLYEVFGCKIPQFGHLSFIVGNDRQKLSKRHGASSCNDFRERGYLPEALLNYIALLGWSSPTGAEILSVKEMIENFSLDRFNSSPAVFDEVKLTWVNAMHLRALPHDELWRRVKPFLDQAGLKLPDDPKWQDQALTLFKIKMETLAQAVPLFAPLDDSKFSIEPAADEVLVWPEARKVLEAWKAELNKISSERMTEEQFNQAQDTVKNSAGVKGKQLFMPIRVGVVGEPHGSELKHVVPLLSKASLLNRVDQAIKALKV